MNFDELKKKATDLAGDHQAEVEQGVDKAAEFAKDKVDGHDEQIDGAAEKLKGFLPKN